MNEFQFTELVVFDEAENAFGSIPVPPIGTPLPPMLPATSLVDVGDASVFPQPDNGAVAGWAYMNLDGTDINPPRADMAWVISSMRAEGRYSGDMETIAFGNGCSNQVPQSEVQGGMDVIAPSPNTTP